MVAAPVERQLARATAERRSVSAVAFAGALETASSRLARAVFSEKPRLRRPANALSQACANCGDGIEP
jgi:hypothetical protein